jgi:diaminopimelate decarboxylase
LNIADPTLCQLSQGVHLIDQQTLEDRASAMNREIWPDGRGGNFYAVKGNPNHYILKTLGDQGFGFDCSSPTEILDALKSGVGFGRMMYTANATPSAHLKFAMDKGAILNLDDIVYLGMLEEVPKVLSFRVNIAGMRKDGGQNKIIGEAGAQKYGVPYEKIISAFRKAKGMGVQDFGLHTMYATNNRSWKVHCTTLQILLEIAKKLKSELGIQLKFVNAGGGIGIDYKHPDDRSIKYGEEDKPFDLRRYGIEVNLLLREFEFNNGWRPDFYLECARYPVAPAGIWVAPIIAVTQKYRRFACMAACDGSDLLRAGMYPTHHHVDVLDSNGNPVHDRPIIKQSIVGPLCENIHAASQRFLPRIIIGDLVVFFHTGCHGIVMGMDYNGWTKSAQVMRMSDGTLKLISRAQTIADIRCLQVPLV